jgi:UDP-2,3-diacylglucosamine hydrolase
VAGIVHHEMTMPAALFVSDLHLQPSHPKTSRGFYDFLERHAMAAQALYVLGDLFEYWAGDDDMDAPLPRQTIEAIRRVSDAGVAVYWIAGNRDFLAGPAFAEATGATILSEPHVATIGGQRIVLVHGDAQCTDDINYMAFRAQVREPAWQAQFLAMPLAQRKAIIAGMRQDSRADQDNKSYGVMDVTAQAIGQVFAQTNTRVMIHGHTHRPALHETAVGRRYVLPDWDLDARPPRGGWIAVGGDGAIMRCALDGSPLAP